MPAAGRRGKRESWQCARQSPSAGLFARSGRHTDCHGVIGQIPHRHGSRPQGDAVSNHRRSQDAGVYAQRDIVSKRQFTPLYPPPDTDAVAAIQSAIFPHDGVAVNYDAQGGMPDLESIADGGLETDFMAAAQEPEQQPKRQEKHPQGSPDIPSQQIATPVKPVGD